MGKGGRDGGAPMNPKTYPLDPLEPEFRDLKKYGQEKGVKF